MLGWLKDLLQTSHEYGRCKKNYLNILIFKITQNTNFFSMNADVAFVVIRNSKLLVTILALVRRLVRVRQLVQCKHAALIEALSAMANIWSDIFVHQIAEIF